MKGMTFQIDIEGLDKLTRMFMKAPEVIEPIMQDAVVDSTVSLASHTDRDTVPWRTGTLGRSFNPVKIERLLARWFPRVDYAKAVQFGLSPSPGRYVPAIKRRLVNGNNIGMWPGFAGRHFMENILSASEDEIHDIFRRAVKEATRAMST